MQKEMLFIPGHNDQLSLYPGLMQRIKMRGYRVFDLKMDWNVPKDPNEYLKQVSDQVGDTIFDTIAGFSFGGPTALLLSSKFVEQKRPPKRLLLCSHSAIFKDDVDDYTRYYQLKGEPVPDTYGQIEANSLISNITNASPSIKVDVFYGQQELEMIKKRAKKTAAQLGIQPLEVFSAIHDPEHPYYQEAIMRNLPMV